MDRRTLPIENGDYCSSCCIPLGKGDGQRRNCFSCQELINDIKNTIEEGL